MESALGRLKLIVCSEPVCMREGEKQNTNLEKQKHRPILRKIIAFEQ